MICGIFHSTLLISHPILLYLLHLPLFYYTLSIPLKTAILSQHRIVDTYWYRIIASHSNEYPICHSHKSSYLTINQYSDWRSWSNQSLPRWTAHCIGVQSLPLLYPASSSDPLSTHPNCGSEHFPPNNYCSQWNSSGRAASCNSRTCLSPERGADGQSNPIIHLNWIQIRNRVTATLGRNCLAPFPHTQTNEDYSQ